MTDEHIGPFKHISAPPGHACAPTRTSKPTPGGYIQLHELIRTYLLAKPTAVGTMPARIRKSNAVLSGCENVSSSKVTHQIMHNNVLCATAEQSREAHLHPDWWGRNPVICGRTGGVATPATDTQPPIRPSGAGAGEGVPELEIPHYAACIHPKNQVAQLHHAQTQI